MARVHCPICGGEVQGWICQRCHAEFRDGDDGELVPDSLRAMRRALFLLESPLNDDCIRQSPSVAFLRATIASLEEAA
jgi:hypothetical protein